MWSILKIYSKITGNLDLDVSGFSGSGCFRKKRVGEFGGGQILAHLLGSIKILSFMYKFELGHDGADVKNRENYIYVAVQYLLYNL